MRQVWISVRNLPDLENSITEYYSRNLHMGLSVWVHTCKRARGRRLMSEILLENFANSLNKNYWILFRESPARAYLHQHPCLRSHTPARVKFSKRISQILSKNLRHEPVRAFRFTADPCLFRDKKLLKTKPLVSCEISLEILAKEEIWLMNTYLFFNARSLFLL